MSIEGAPSAGNMVKCFRADEPVTCRMLDLARAHYHWMPHFLRFNNPVNFVSPMDTVEKETELDAPPHLQLKERNLVSTPGTGPFLLVGINAHRLRMQISTWG